MKPLAAEWVAKAEGDFRTATRELTAPDEPNFDSACFHAQQCAEKYLKALLTEKDISFPKTHDLSALISLVAPSCPGWKAFVAQCDALTDSAVEVRYPGFSASREDAQAALETAERIRSAARAVLGLPPPQGTPAPQG